MTVYDFSAKTITGEEKSLRDYEGKVLLIVNVASKCGFTPQYKGLQSVYEKYKEQGFEILGFPCNQFGGQEPGTEDQITSFCE
ncbi:glutathione peroxidase, partial [Bacillus sp. AFS019443]